MIMHAPNFQSVNFLEFIDLGVVVKRLVFTPIKILNNYAEIFFLIGDAVLLAENLQFYRNKFIIKTGDVTTIGDLIRMARINKVDN
jgi:hypothetical protein